MYNFSLTEEQFGFMMDCVAVVKNNANEIQNTFQELKTLRDANRKIVNDCIDLQCLMTEVVRDEDLVK